MRHLKNCIQCGAKIQNNRPIKLIKFCDRSCKAKYEWASGSKEIVREKISLRNKERFKDKSLARRQTEKFRAGCMRKFKLLGYIVPVEHRMFGEKNPAKRTDVRRKISESRLGRENPVHRMTAETKLRRKEKIIEFYRIHPERHPNVVMASKGFISKPQKELYANILLRFADAQVEYPVQTKNSVRFIDVAVPSIRIGFEFDGEYWHRDKSKDEQRDNELIEVGWTIIHFNYDSFKELPKILEEIKQNPRCRCTLTERYEP